MIAVALAEHVVRESGGRVAIEAGAMIE